MHEAEWRGSVMHYAAQSPVFNAFELTVQKLTDGRFSPNGTDPDFCNQCHSPTGVQDGEVPNYTGPDQATALSANLSSTALDGLSCDFCHTVTEPALERSVLGDGISNLALEFAPSPLKRGPFGGAVPNESHRSVQSDYLGSSQFCGACHDVRIPVPDALSGEPFQRLENLFSEWEASPYRSTDNPYGRVVSCQDCHMSLYPMEPPGTYPQTSVAVSTPKVERRHAMHAFTAVSIPLIDDPRFPNTHTDVLDSWGYPMGQEQRRRQMLQAAVTLDLSGTPAAIEPDAPELPVRLLVTNVGAGHRVPSGFSQEREVWIELVVRDDVGLIYASGTLRDQAHPETGEWEPDGRLNDEDLEEHHFEINIDTFESHYQPGRDRDQRPTKNLGLVNFQNRFVHVNPDGSRDRVLNPLAANAMDNTHSLPILEPVEVLYDVPLERALVGSIQVSVRLRYRSFPPEFLRFLAQREPSLVTEDTIDRNTIVDMAQTTTTILLK